MKDNFFRRVLLSLLAGSTVVLGDPEDYDLNCFYRVSWDPLINTCQPCGKSAVSGGACTEYMYESCETQKKCCEGLHPECMDSWDSCRGSTSYVPGTTNEQCNSWCESSDPAYDANCGVEGYNWDTINTVLTPWSTNKCFFQWVFGYDPEQDPLGSYKQIVDVDSLWACQDLCREDPACAFFTFAVLNDTCGFKTSEMIEKALDITITPDGTVENMDFDYCNSEIPRTCTGTSGYTCLACTGTTMSCVFQQDSYITGPRECYVGYNPCDVPSPGPSPIPEEPTTTTTTSSVAPGPKPSTIAKQSTPSTTEVTKCR